MNKYFTILFDLVKYKVTLAVAFTTIAGYLIYSGHFNVDAIVLGISIFFLAGGASALNECQESKYDILMERTKNRPIPAGLITLPLATTISILFILLGLSLLYLCFNTTAAILGLINLVWYNVIYTYLKRYSSFAVVPGSMVGAIPVVIGWTAAGGEWYVSSIIFIAFFLFIWQVPHFWLLMLKYSDEYENAGFKTINKVVSPTGLKNIIYSWVIATSFSSIIVPLFLIHISLYFFILVFILNLIFIGVFTKLTFGDMIELNFRKSFISINIYMLSFLFLLICFHVFS